jgi:hypothetical protein
MLNLDHQSSHYFKPRKEESSTPRSYPLKYLIIFLGAWLIFEPNGAEKAHMQLFQIIRKGERI